MYSGKALTNPICLLLRKKGAEPLKNLVQYPRTVFDVAKSVHLFGRK